MIKLLKHIISLLLIFFLIGGASCVSSSHGKKSKGKGRGGADCPAFRGGKPSGKSGPRKVGWF